MAKQEFFIAPHEGEQSGPMTLEKVQEALKERRVRYTDYLWDPQASAWVLLAVYFQDQFPAPKAPPAGVKVAPVPASAAKTKLPDAQPDLKRFTSAAFDQQFGVSNESIWFLYKDKEKYGPYRFLEVVQLLQEMKCDQADFIWKPGMNDWERIRNVAEYQPEILKRLSNVKNFSGINLDTVFIKRQFPRVPYDSEVILHDDRQVVIGSATTISEGGAFVRVSKPVHQRGDRLKLHFSAAGVPVPFNCIAEVTQVCKTEPAGYCLKFIYLEQEDQERIADYASKENRA